MKCGPFRGGRGLRRRCHVAKPDYSWLLARLSVANGVPCAGGVTTRAVFDQFRLGVPLASVAILYRVTVANCEDALRFEFALRRGQSWAMRWLEREILREKRARTDMVDAER
jgi:hypothetical protein